MNKRDFSKKIKNITTKIDTYLNDLKPSTSNLKQAIVLIDNLDSHFESHVLTPPNWNVDELIQDTLIEFFDNDNDIIEILELIKDLRDELNNFIDGLGENSTKLDVWESVQSELENIEECLDIEENNITSIGLYEESLKELKKDLESLI